jgi:hypothetical protein
MKRFTPGWVRAGTALIGALMAAGCAAPPASPAHPAEAPGPSLSAQGAGGALLSDYGIAVHGLHRSAHGYILDLRFRVRDPARAALLLDGGRKVQLLDGMRNARLGVPESPVIGGMRQTSRNHVVYTDRDYFILFVNPGRAVQPGDILELAVDGRRLGALTVGGETKG